METVWAWAKILPLCSGSWGFRVIISTGVTAGSKGRPPHFDCPDLRPVMILS